MSPMLYVMTYLVHNPVMGQWHEHQTTPIYLPKVMEYLHVIEHDDGLGFVNLVPFDPGSN